VGEKKKIVKRKLPQAFEFKSATYCMGRLYRETSLVLARENGMSKRKLQTTVKLKVAIMVFPANSEKASVRGGGGGGAFTGKAT